MFEVVSDNLADLVRQSADYKVISLDGWLYIFMANADFDRLMDNQHSIIWDQQAVLVISDHGKITKNRFGPVE